MLLDHTLAGVVALSVQAKGHSSALQDAGTLVNSTTQYNPVINFCSRGWHQSTVKNGVLYIDGGVETFIDIVNGYQCCNVTLGFNNYLIAIDMTRPWDWYQNISEVALVKTDNPVTGTPPPSLINGVLYQGAAEDPRFYLYAGTTSYLNQSFVGWEWPWNAQYSLWSYDTNTSTWNQYDISDASPWRPSSGFYAEAPDQGLAFYLNGEIEKGSSTNTMEMDIQVEIFLEGMIIIDTTTQTAVNVSTNGFSGYLPRIKGGMLYVPNIGQHGILVAIGGAYKYVDEIDDIELSTFVSMTEIAVFDIDSYYNGDSASGWYTQTATGQIPGERAEFCVVLMSPPDNSSFNIYLYAGLGPNNLMYDDVYVLSLPSFTWTRAYGPGESPRYGHTCHAVGSQLITVGGWLWPNITTWCDWENKSVGVMDLSTLEWGSKFDPSKTNYTVPNIVLESIGGANGTKSLTEPNGGFSSPELAALFKKTSTRHGGMSAAVVAGAVAGSVLAVAVIVGLVFWWRRLQKKARNGIKFVPKSSSAQRPGTYEDPNLGGKIEMSEIVLDKTAQ